MWILFVSIKNDGMIYLRNILDKSSYMNSYQLK